MINNLKVLPNKLLNNLKIITLISINILINLTIIIILPKYSITKINFKITIITENNLLKISSNINRIMILMYKSNKLNIIKIKPININQNSYTHPNISNHLI